MEKAREWAEAFGDEQYDHRFVTFTLRRGRSVNELLPAGKHSVCLPLDQRSSFKVVKSAIYAAVDLARRPRKGGSRWRGKLRSSWPGLDVKIINSVDVTEEGMAHAHVLMSVRPVLGGHVPSDREIAVFLWQAFDRAVARLLHVEHAGERFGRDALGHVDFQPCRGTEAAARYMSLHNKKVWLRPWCYPSRYRRISSSKHWVPQLEYEKSEGWVFNRRSLSMIVALSAQRGHEPCEEVVKPDGSVTAVTLRYNARLDEAAICVFGGMFAWVPRPLIDFERMEADKLGLGRQEYWAFRQCGQEGLETLPDRILQRKQFGGPRLN